MTNNNKETNTPGSSRTPVKQAKRNSSTRLFPKTAGNDAGTSSKNMTTMREKTLHPGIREWS